MSEIPGIVEEFKKAAVNGKRAGFDGIEVHGANGYLLDQFLEDGSNKRTDEYGGSFENRIRITVEVLEKLVTVFDSNRVGIRLSVGGTWNGMSDSNWEGLIQFVGKRLNDFNLAYINVIEPRVAGAETMMQNERPSPLSCSAKHIWARSLTVADIIRSQPKPRSKEGMQTRSSLVATSSLIPTRSNRCTFGPIRPFP